jgi:hypothetical protein
MNGTKYEGFGANYGYPECAAVWEPETKPSLSNFKVGTQFANYYEAPLTNKCAKPDSAAWGTDAQCKDRIPPRITLPSHWAPIDMKFNSKGTVAYMTARGSW